MCYSTYSVGEKKSMTKNVTHLCVLEGMLLNLIPTTESFKELSPKNFKIPQKLCVVDRYLDCMENLGFSMKAITDQTFVKMLLFKQIHSKSNDCCQIHLEVWRKILKMRPEGIEPQAICSTITIATIYFTLH